MVNLSDHCISESILLSKSPCYPKRNANEEIVYGGESLIRILSKVVGNEIWFATISRSESRQPKWSFQLVNAMPLRFLLMIHFHGQCTTWRWVLHYNGLRSRTENKIKSFSIPKDKGGVFLKIDLPLRRMVFPKFISQIVHYDRLLFCPQ